jgi:hypothetical protein
VRERRMMLDESKRASERERKREKEIEDLIIDTNNNKTYALQFWIEPSGGKV